MKKEIRCFKMVGVSMEAQESVERGDGKYCKIQTFRVNGSSTQYAKELSNHTPELDREELIVRLASVYKKDMSTVATICDEVLDRTGGLLGDVRKAARKTVDAKEYLLTREIKDGDTTASVMEDYYQFKLKELNK